MGSRCGLVCTQQPVFIWLSGATSFDLQDSLMPEEDAEGQSDLPLITELGE